MIGEPVLGRKLPGREGLIKELLTYAKKPSVKKRHMVLASLRKCGRSSITAAFAKGICGRGTRVLTLDFNQRSPEALVEHVIHALVLGLVPQRSGKQENEALPELLRRLPRTIDKVGPELQDLWERWGGRMDEAELLARCLQLPARIQGAAGGNVWIVVDNFDRLAAVMGDGFVSGFREVLGSTRKVRWFLAGTPPAVMQRLASQGNALDSAEVFAFHGFSYNESMKLIQRETSVKALPQPYRAFLAALTGGHPFYLQLWIDGIQRSKRELGRRAKPEKIVIEALVSELFAGAGRLNLYFDGLLSGAFNGWRAPELYTGMLEAIARGHSSLAGISHFIRRDAPALSRQVQNLLDSGLVNKDGTRYYISDALLRLWMRHVYLARHEARSPGYSREDAFRGYFNGLLEDFLKTTGTETVRRVASILAASDGKAALSDGEDEEQTEPIPRFDQIELQQKLGETSFDLVARKGNNYWLFSIHESTPASRRVSDFASKVTEASKAISGEQTVRPILLVFEPLTKVLSASAFRHKLTVWGRKDINRLAECYGMLPIVG